MGEFSPPFSEPPSFFFFFLSLKYWNNIWFLWHYYKNSPPISKSWIRPCVTQLFRHRTLKRFLMGLCTGLPRQLLRPENASVVFLHRHHSRFQGKFGGKREELVAAGYKVVFEKPCSWVTRGSYNLCKAAAKRKHWFVFPTRDRNDEILSGRRFQWSF